MALTVVKYRKTGTGETSSNSPAILIKSKLSTQSQQTTKQIMKKPIIKLEGGTGLVINKIPASVIPTMKRNSTTTVDPTTKSAKYSLQTITSAGTPVAGFQWQPTTGGITITKRQQQIGAAISSLPPNTIIQARSGNVIGNLSGTHNTIIQTNGTTKGTTITPTIKVDSAANNTVQIRRPTVFIKREFAKRTIRTVTLELIEKNPQVHLGVSQTYLRILKNIICPKTNITLVDCYLTLKKLRQNEEFTLLAEYFDMNETQVQQIFARTIVKLYRYLRFLIRWPNSKKFYDRHKNLPFTFRSDLSHIQSLIECVETDMHQPLQINCSNYKFILSITPTGLISYISEAYFGQYDDLTIFNTANFQSVIPSYLSLCVDPSLDIRKRKKLNKNNTQKDNQLINADTDSNTDSADESSDETEPSLPLSKYAASRVAAEVATNQTLNIVNSELTSRKVKDLRIPTIRVREPDCRFQIRQMIKSLREFKVLQPYGIQETILYQYLNEILVVVAALTNLQR